MRGFEHNFDYFDKVLKEAPFNKGASILTYLHQSPNAIPKHMEDSKFDDKSLRKIVKVWNWTTFRLSEKNIKETSKGREFIKLGTNTLYLDEFKKYEQEPINNFIISVEYWYYNLEYKYENGKLFVKYKGSSNDRYVLSDFKHSNSKSVVIEAGVYTFFNVVMTSKKFNENEFVELTFNKVWKK